MREIKFRFVLECDGDLYYSKVVKNMNEIIEHNYLIDELIEDGGCNQGNIAFNDAFVDRDWIIQHTPQFTGLKDKNDVEIYEGDIVLILDSDFPDDDDKSYWQIKHLNGTFTMFYSKADYYYLDSNIDSFMCSFPSSWVIEVIGNIYESPELINKEEASYGIA